MLNKSRGVRHAEARPPFRRILPPNTMLSLIFTSCLPRSPCQANEAAIKFARRVAKAKAVAAGMAEEESATQMVAFTRSFHGRTMGALALTANPKYKSPFLPMLDGVHQATYGDLESAAALIKKGETCMVIIEPVQGEGGVWPAQAAFLQGLRKLCDDAGALLVFDEVQCGLGRTGKMFGHDHFGVAPDLMTLAKPLAAGLPIGAVLMTQAVANTIHPGDHGSTFAGNPLVCRAGEVVMDRLEGAGFLESVNERGAQLMDGLRAGLKDCAIVSEVRGLGLIVGVQMTKPAGPAVGACRDKGLLVLTAGAGDVMRILPPLVVTEAEIAQAVDIIVECIKADAET
jgi:acetylornithine aminotransferase